MAKIIKLNQTGKDVGKAKSEDKVKVGDKEKKRRGRPKKEQSEEEKILEQLYFSGIYDGPDMTARELYEKIKGIKDYHGAGRKPYRILKTSIKEVLIRDKRSGEELTITMMEMYETLSLDRTDRTVKNLKKVMPLKHASAVAALFWYISYKDTWGTAWEIFAETLRDFMK